MGKKGFFQLVRKDESTSSESLELVTPKRRRPPLSDEPRGTPLKRSRTSSGSRSPVGTGPLSSTPLMSRDPARTSGRLSTSKSSLKPYKVVPKEEFEDEDYAESEPANRSSIIHKVAPTKEKVIPASPRRTRSPARKVIPLSHNLDVTPKKSPHLSGASMPPPKRASKKLGTEKDSDEEARPKKVIPSSSRAVKSAKPFTFDSAQRSQRSTETVVEQGSQDKRSGSRRKGVPRKWDKTIVKDIIKQQTSVKNLIPRLPFARVVRGILSTYGDYRVTKEALDAMHEAGEMHLVYILEASYAVSLHAKRKTLLQRDITFLLSLARRYFGCNWW